MKLPSANAIRENTITYIGEKGVNVVVVNLLVLVPVPVDCELVD